MKQFTYILLFIVLNTIQQRLHAQDPLMDSLKLALKFAKHDTTRISSYLELSNICALEEVPKFANPIIELCEINLKKENISEHLRFFYLSHLATAQYNNSQTARQEGEDNKALVYLLKSLKIREEIKDKEGIATSLNDIADIYDSQGDIPKALEYYHRSLKIYEEINYKKGIAAALNNIGYIYQNQNDYQKAMENYSKCLKLLEEIHFKNGIAVAYNNIGRVYELQGNLGKAMDYYQKCLNISYETQDKSEIAIALNQIGAIYESKGDRLKALSHFQESLKISETINFKEGLATTLNSISNVLLSLGKLNEALVNAKRGMEYSKELGYPDNIQNAASCLKNVYKKQSKYKEAFAMYELEIQMQDSINNETTKKASIKKQFQYAYEKQASADSVKHAEEQKVKNAQLAAQSASLKQEKTQRYALYGGLLLVIAFSGFVFNRFRVTQKQKKIIEEQKILVDEAYEHLHEKNKEVMDSIYYARRIQRALITPEAYIDKTLNKLNKT